LPAIAFSVFKYLPGYAIAQNMIQRYICSGGVREGRGVVALSALINITLGFVFLLVGVALFAFYTQPGGGGLPILESEDQILPHFVATQAVGTGLIGLVLAGLFAAAMSTVDSGINGVGSGGSARCSDKIRDEIPNKVMNRTTPSPYRFARLACPGDTRIESGVASERAS
jgi:Na+/proline symporter